MEVVSLKGALARKDSLARGLSWFVRKESLTRSLVHGFLFEDSCEEEFSRKEGVSSRKEAVAGQESHTRGVSYEEAARAAARLAQWRVSILLMSVTGEVWSFVVTGKR